MTQGNRGVDDSFLPSHRLYFRFSPENYVDGELLEANIPVANQSVNWSKYSKPWDVKFEHPGWGIAQIYVSDIPERLPEVLSSDPNDRFHIFMPRHVPEPSNYSHSEIQVTKDGRVADASKVSKNREEDVQIHYPV